MFYKQPIHASDNWSTFCNKFCKRRIFKYNPIGSHLFRMKSYPMKKLTRGLTVNVFGRFGEDSIKCNIKCTGKSGVIYDSLNPNALSKIRDLETGKKILHI